MKADASQSINKAATSKGDGSFGTLDMTLGLEWKSPRGLLGGTRE